MVKKKNVILFLGLSIVTAMNISAAHDTSKKQKVGLTETTAAVYRSKQEEKDLQRQDELRKERRENEIRKGQRQRKREIRREERVARQSGQPLRQVAQKLNF